MKFRLSGRGNLLAAVVIIGVAGILGTIWVGNTVDRGRREIETFREASVERHRARLHSLLDVAYGAVVSRYRSEMPQRDALGEEHLKAEILEMLRQLRYGKDDYFWVNDLQPSMLMHPFVQRLEGRDLHHFRDPDGIQLFDEFVRVCREQGEGFVAYSWPRPGRTNPQPKLSYVRLFEPWGWIIGTGTYIDDVDAEVLARERRVREAVHAQVFQILGFTVAACLLVAVYTAIAERKRQVGAAVAVSEERLNRIVAGAPDGILIFDAENGCILHSNPAAAALLGSTAEQMAGNPVGSSVFSAVEEAVALGRQEIAIRDQTFGRSDGSSVDLEATGTFLDFQGKRCVAVFLRDVTQRRRAEGEVRRHQGLLASILDNVSNGILVLDAARRVTYYNRVFAESWGVGKDILDSRPTIESLLHRFCEIGLYAEDQADFLIQRRLEQLEGEGPRRRIDTPRRDGVIMEAYATPLPGGGHLLTYRDVTEEQEAAQALREQMEFCESLVRNSAIATFVLGADHRVLFWNLACEQLTGKTAIEMVGTWDHWRAFYRERRPCLADFVIDPPGETDERTHYYSVYGSSTLVVDALHGESWYRDLGGCDRYLVFDAAPIRNRRGELVAVVETLQDLTALKKAEEARSLLATAVEQSAEAIVITGTNGHIQYINPAFSAITGYSREEVLGKMPMLYRNTTQDQAFYAHMKQTLSSGEVWKGELVNQRKDGSLYQEETTISPVRDESGHVLNFVSVHRDVTAEREIQRRSAQGQRLEALGTLAGGIAHDFNNILTAIMGFAELALDETPSGDAVRGHLKRIMDGTSRARDLVAQILAFSRSDVTGTSSSRYVAVAPLVEETMQFLRASLPHVVNVRWRTGSVACSVRGDASQLYQVLLNLCTNAAQAMDSRGGVLDVSVKEVGAPRPGSTLPAGRYVQCSVSDTGPGIAPEHVDHIFEPFFTTKPVGQGTGMGLAVVHGIIRSMGGEVVVWSQLGEGTCFDIYLPIAETPVNDSVPARDLPVPRGRGRVLVVDDEDVVTELVAQVLRHLGYEAVAFTDSREALQRFKEDPSMFSLVITDHAMPYLTGPEMLEQMHHLRADLPVVLCTGDRRAVTPDLSRRLGIRVVLQKPMTRRELADAAARALAANGVVEYSASA